MVVFFYYQYLRKDVISMVSALRKNKIYELLWRWKLYRVNRNSRKAVKILIAVVIGALVLASLYTLFGETVMPALTQRVRDMFNHNG